MSRRRQASSSLSSVGTSASLRADERDFDSYNLALTEANLHNTEMLLAEIEEDIRVPNRWALPEAELRELHREQLGVRDQLRREYANYVQASFYNASDTLSHAGAVYARSEQGHRRRDRAARTIQSAWLPHLYRPEAPLVQRSRVTDGMRAPSEMTKLVQSMSRLRLPLAGGKRRKGGSAARKSGGKRRKLASQRRTRKR